MEGTLQIVHDFFKTLEGKGVEYVHWKSNLNLHQALLGGDDLDILVNPRDRNKLLKVFKEFKIIRGYSEKDYWQKDVLHYYAVDSTMGIIIHIHLHFALPVGYDYNKNFILPINEAVFKRKQKLRGVYVPCPEQEYVILIIRILIKNALTPFLLSAPRMQVRLLLGDKIIKGNALAEFKHLSQIISREKLREVLREDFSQLHEDLFHTCEQVILDNKSLKRFLQVAHNLKKTLEDWKSDSEAHSFTVSFTRINKIRLRKIFKRLPFYKPLPDGKIPEYGGRIFAFIGGDGAGKSTNIEKLRKKLKENFKTASIHIGKPPKSGIGFLLYYTSMILKRINIGEAADLLMNVRLAIDRKQAFDKAVKLREKGVLVILDRIPTKEITAMDAPRINPMKYPRLSRWEICRYTAIRGVDLLFVMKLNPEIALLRRPEDNAENLRIRSGQVWTTNWDAAYQVVNDTGVLGYDEVERNILKSVWDNLNNSFLKIELVGMSGTGKSTLIDLLRHDKPNCRTIISLRKRKRTLLLMGLRTPVTLAKKMLGVKMTFGESMKLSYRAQKYIYRENVLNTNTNTILDQGIVFYLVASLKEKSITISEFSEVVKKIKNYFDFVVLLKGTKETLFKRIKSRERQGIGRAKDMSHEDFSIFYDDYLQAFEMLKETDLDILEIDTEQHKPQEIVNMILNYKATKG